MNLQLTVRNVLAFLVFAMLIGEAHEIAHFMVGKIVCGCWPEIRDFNSWSLCDCSVGHWATIAGPVFSIGLAWVGLFLLKSDSSRRQSLGFLLIWSTVPQARIMTVLMGGGDEMVFFREVTHETILQNYFQYIVIIVVLLATLPPIVAAFRTVQNKYGWLYNIGFMVLPLVILGIYGFGLLNPLLQNGFLAKTWIMGTPLFITLHTLVLLVIFLIFLRTEIFTLVRNKEKFLYQ